MVPKRILGIVRQVLITARGGDRPPVGIEASTVRGPHHHMFQLFRRGMNMIRGEARLGDEVGLPEPMATKDVPGGVSSGIREGDAGGGLAGDQAEAAGGGDHCGGEKVVAAAGMPRYGDRL